MFGEGVLGACCAAWFAIKLARERVQAIILASAGWMVEDARIVELIGGCLEETRIQKGDDVDAPLPPEVTQGWVLADPEAHRDAGVQGADDDECVCLTYSIASYYFGWPPRRPERAKEYMDHLQVTCASAPLSSRHSHQAEHRCLIARADGSGHDMQDCMHFSLTEPVKLVADVCAPREQSRTSWTFACASASRRRCSRRSRSPSCCSMAAWTTQAPAHKVCAAQPSCLGSLLRGEAESFEWPYNSRRRVA